MYLVNKGEGIMTDSFSAKKVKRIDKSTKQSIYFMYRMGKTAPEIGLIYNIDPRRVLKIVNEVHIQTQKAVAKKQAKQIYGR